MHKEQEEIKTSILAIFDLQGHFPGLQVLLLRLSLWLRQDLPHKLMFLVPFLRSLPRGQVMGCMVLFFVKALGIFRTRDVYF